MQGRAVTAGRSAAVIVGIMKASRCLGKKEGRAQRSPVIVRPPVLADTGRCALPICESSPPDRRPAGTLTAGIYATRLFPALGRSGRRLRRLTMFGASTMPERPRRVKTLANIGGPPCAEVSTEGRPRGPGNDMPGHAAHEAQQGGADGRHKAVAATAADETLPDGIRACSGRAFINPFAGLKIFAAPGGRPQLFAGQRTESAAAAGGQGDFPIKGASRAGAILSFIVACGILGAG